VAALKAPASIGEPRRAKPLLEGPEPSPA
jgi:hypothetical protein